ncbi:hypothetical protein CLV51_1011099 [Chitinophaga niastensis]|uniref:Lipoprotein n=1 Tax=Chitinophaga niastensis TaxID=536980 RepID=A0A2P8HU73_CHINA|nr:hypothetical protein [Chitinophaga niastensis]PSL49763.1 hypothetical protein CLV51_1011099 [Chitinophaga niastensis]
MKSYFSTNRVLAWTIGSVVVATLFFACKKQVTTDTAPNNESDNTTFTAAAHEVKVSGIYSDLFQTVSTVAVSQGVARQGSSSKDMAANPSCPSAELDITSNTWPKHLKVDFGPSCADAFGTYRSGVWNITLDGPLRKAGSTFTVSLSNYKVDGIPVEGTVTIRILSYNTTDGIQFSSEVTGGRVSFSDSLIVDYVSKRTFKQIEGGATPDIPSNAGFSVDGTATLTYEKGAPAGTVITFTTLTSLIKRWSCGHIVQGQLKIDFNNISGVIDYGDGKCDSIATIKIGDKVKEIKL